jgi:hypothetical protein
MRKARDGPSESMSRVNLIVHERRGLWARQLRPRVAGWPVRLIESRSRDDLAAALGRAPHSLAVVDVGNNARGVLEDLIWTRPIERDALVLVLDPNRNEIVASLARELGACLAIQGFCPPPRVAAILERWHRLCLARKERAGWIGECDSDSES